MNVKTQIPLFMSPVCAGFPSPANDYVEKKLDLNEHLIKHPAATFFVRAAGDSMINAGIHHNDILVVDRALEPINNRIVIAIIEGELTVKRILKSQDRLFLMPDNTQYKSIEVTEEMNVEIWGVVTTIIHSV